MCSPLAGLRPGRNNPCKRSTARQPLRLLALRTRPTMDFLLVDALMLLDIRCAQCRTKHNALLHASSGSATPPPRRPSPEQTFRKCLRTCQPHPHELESGIFFFLSWSKVKWKFTMTFRLIHTHLASFYSSCLRKARSTKFAEMRGGGIKKKRGNT